MASATYLFLNYICPSLGTIMASLTFAAPIGALRERLARGSLGSLNPTPWAFMLGNCAGWVAYSYLTKDLFVLASNAPGLILSVWLNMGAVKLQYRAYRAWDDGSVRSRGRIGDDGNDDDDGDDRGHDFGAFVPHERKVLHIFALWVVIFSAVAHIDMTRYTREEIIGVCNNIMLCFFYGAPLSTIAQVIRTGSSDSLHALTVTMMVLNALFWLGYGIAVGDPFIFVPNGIGCALGGAQVLLLVIFPRKPDTSSGSAENGRDQLLGQENEQDEQAEDGFSNDSMVAVHTLVQSGGEGII
jgi:solute carrier family 50 protein (sugar transporter)